MSEKKRTDARELTITLNGPAASGKSAVANSIQIMLEANGYKQQPGNTDSMRRLLDSKNGKHRIIIVEEV